MSNASTAIVAYYAATLLFLILDLGLGINVRVAFLEDWPAWRALYYGICFGCFVLLLARPGLAVPVGAVESLVTLVALIINMATRSMPISDDLLETGYGFATMPEIVNFLISGGAAYLSWTRAMTALRR